MRGVIHIALRTTSAHPHRAGCWVHTHAFHHRQIDDQPVVATPQSRSIVAAAAYGNEELIVAAEVHCRDHVGHVRAARDHERSLVDHSVVELARVLVVGVVAPDQRTAKTLAQFGHGFLAHDFLSKRAASDTSSRLLWVLPFS